MDDNKELRHIETDSGFVCDIDPDCMDDMEVLELVVRIDKGDTTAYPEYAEKILGEDGKRRLYDHLRGSTGRVPVSATMDELSDIISKFRAEGKVKK